MLRRIIAKGLLAVACSGVLSGLLATPAAAAEHDPRIFVDRAECVNTYGVTPLVRALQPYVLGNRPTPETIYWMPYLQVRVGIDAWVSTHRSTNWHSFQATRNGPDYNFIIQRQLHLFENQTPGYDYRILYVVFWGSTGELGTRISSACRL